MKNNENDRILDFSLKVSPSRKKVIIKVECNEMISYDDLRDVIDHLESDSISAELNIN